MSTSHNRNPSGKNGHTPFLVDANYWCPVVQKYLDQGVKLKDLPARIFEDHQVSTSERSLSRLINEYELRTARQPRMSVEEMESRIAQVRAQDPLQEWGIRLIQEELRGDSIHIPRGLIQAFEKQRNPAEATRRWSGNKKIVRKSLVSSGPNEEWCMDGHEKLSDSMGIDVWGICDKYSWLELGLWAVPNAHQSEVPIALFLRVVKEQGGVPLQLTGDKGSENGKVSMVQTALRTYISPSLSVSTFPPVRLVRSVRNITRERGWRPIWEKELKNILEVWRDGQLGAKYNDGDTIHRELGTWLWAKLVQARLDRLRERQAHHRIRLQRRVLLPTGGTAYDFYHNPGKFRATNMLIKIPDSGMTEIDELIETYPADGYLQFGDENSITFFESLYEHVSPGKLTLENAWDVWEKMLALLKLYVEGV